MLDLTGQNLLCCAQDIAKMFPWLKLIFNANSAGTSTDGAKSGSATPFVIHASGEEIHVFWCDAICSLIWHIKCPREDEVSAPKPCLISSYFSMCKIYNQLEMMPPGKLLPMIYSILNVLPPAVYLQSFFNGMCDWLNGNHTVGMIKGFNIYIYMYIYVLTKSIGTIDGCRWCIYIYIYILISFVFSLT